MIEEKIKLKTLIAMKCSHLQEEEAKHRKVWERGKPLHRNLSKRSKVAATFTMMLLVTTLIAALLPEATAAPSPVNIDSIYPESGRVGDVVRVIGEIDTTNGSYKIFFDEDEVKNGTTVGTAVNDTFTVPLSVKGNHNVTLYDVANDNRSLPVAFNVTTSYYVSAEPARIQEGLNTTITVGVNEAEANATYTFTVNVTDPQPIPASYTATLIVSTNATGSGSNSTLYYGNFSSGANTNYVGTYTIAVIAVNETFTTGSFTVGLTDKPEYRRKYTVLIQGSGYNASETVTVNITIAGESVEGYPKNVTADTDGVVTDSWLILEDAKPGTYSVTLTNATTPGTYKNPADAQNFTVLGAVLLIQAWNVAVPPEPSVGVTVVARNVTTNAVLDVRDTNETGWAEFPVDLDNYTFEAELKVEGKIVLVGSLRNQSFTEIKTYKLNLTVWIAYLKIAIHDEAGDPLPFIDVTLDYSYTTRDNQTVPRRYTFVTNTTGIRIFPNMFANISYTIEARRYGNLFNRTEIENLIATRWINITCPTYTMFVHVLDSKGLPLQNVEVAVYEWSSGVAQPVQSNTTNDWGSATFQITFGKYKIWVYSQNRTIILNKTAADLTEDRLFIMIHCKISNVDLSVVVKDYFGNPILNALVKVEREGVAMLEQKTGSKGMASFYNITGGDSRISVSVMGKLGEIRTLYLDGTRVVVFKLEKYVVVGGYPLETTQLITLISLGILVASLALALIYRRLRPGKVSEEKEKSL